MSLFNISLNYSSTLIIFSQAEAPVNLSRQLDTQTSGNFPTKTKMKIKRVATRVHRELDISTPTPVDQGTKGNTSGGQNADTNPFIAFIQDLGTQDTNNGGENAQDNQQTTNADDGLHMWF